MAVKFMSLASGSSGNCYFLGYNDYGILIDAGIGVRTIRKRLKNVGVAMEQIRALFVTHDHTDHIKSAGVMGEELHIPVYTTERIHKGINMNRCTTVKLHSSVRLLDKNQPMQLADFTIEAFEVPHDGTDNVGYCITIDNKTFSFLTDMGEITPMSASYIQRANYLVIEANYDHDMLMNGKYSNHLKARVSSRTGHMCNDDTAAFLASHYTDKLKNIWLCHLSRNNNKPELAYNAVEQALNNAGVVVGRDVQLRCLERTKPSELYLFE